MNTSNQYSPEARERAVRMMRESLESGQSASVVARRNGINPNHLFHWRKLYQDGNQSIA
ncbi:transposase [Azotobacter chroococcum]|jgi:transposase|uniref:Transposase n=1 Tax=Azotobacter chroococcum TaxID=353 RepID=A0AAP9YEM8_9GAMM|nr:transposase [Azotobacter chroococcum]